MTMSAQAAAASGHDTARSSRPPNALQQEIAGKCIDRHDAELIEKAESLARERRARARDTGAHSRFLMGPAWSLLLALFISRIANVEPAVTAVSYEVELPISTCLRWLRQLEDAGLVTSRIDVRDARVRRVALTKEADILVRRHLERT
ncbi:MAG: hypothetical protein GY736_08960 [Sphingomonas sp.]|uniref:DNA-binding MarR family transcriptional regulator n=1 Tax=Sphingomonas aquatilis TaxID=93063 RepID=A0AAW3TYH3_9SPHN|nr:MULTISPECIES: hypothetical protein [Sphingomonas]MBB3877024.1 DNA-binding MarR family transcriptional regulator [Sphingomonas aquatilis]MCP4026421.1 hypothetical protein [Sphingomonas sp.]GEM71960.1 hypothetical protein SAQ01S_17260 [Sphingomonas aquatilis NBRC 16722]